MDNCIIWKFHSIVENFLPNNGVEVQVISYVDHFLDIVAFQLTVVADVFLPHEARYAGVWFPESSKFQFPPQVKHGENTSNQSPPRRLPGE